MALEGEPKKRHAISAEPSNELPTFDTVDQPIPSRARLNHALTDRLVELIHNLRALENPSDEEEQLLYTIECFLGSFQGVMAPTEHVIDDYISHDLGSEREVFRGHDKHIPDTGPTKLLLRMLIADLLPRQQTSSKIATEIVTDATQDKSKNTCRT